VPKLQKDNFNVYDLSRTSDPFFRDAYLGGIVDVYRPHLTNGGYYYDVNSFYPTAMLNPMPVGPPTPICLTPDQFQGCDFFGYVRATVFAPETQYIGLLPIRLNGRLVCPIGSFSGFFFSEELRFALANGYELLSIHQAFSFQRGDATFRDLIQDLNKMKVNAQLKDRPTLRNIAKLLMNSMYGRFGMHADPQMSLIVTPDRAPEICGLFEVLSHIIIGGLELITFTNNPAVTSLPKVLESQFKKEVRAIPGQTNVPIAAAVTAYSRMIINQFKLDAINAGRQYLLLRH
jgi:hypothetical protein